MAKEHFLAFRNHQVFCFEDGAGEAVLFLHNAGNDHRIWEHQLAHFAGGYRVVALDSIGYGQSDRPPVQYALPLYRDMVGAAVETLCLAPVTIIGNCTGASMALAYGSEHPEHVKRLVLVNLATADTIRGGNIEPQVRLLAGRPRLTHFVAPFVEWLMASRFITRRVLRGQCGIVPLDDPEFEAHCHRLYSQRGTMTSYLDLICHWASLRPLDAVARDNLPPVYVVWGECNQVLPARAGREFCKRFGPETAEFVPNGGHLLMRENPSQVNQMIEKILES